VEVWRAHARQPVTEPVTSIEQYQRTLLFQQLGYSPAQIRALGGAARQFSIIAGTPYLSASQVDAGLFVGDDWRVRHNVTLSLGVRYGFGMFYSRFDISNTETAERCNGIVQQEYIVNNPNFFPNVPSIASLTAFPSASTIQEVSSTLRAPSARPTRCPAATGLLRRRPITGGSSCRCGSPFSFVRQAGYRIN